MDSITVTYSNMAYHKEILRFHTKLYWRNIKNCLYPLARNTDINSEGSSLKTKYGLITLCFMVPLFLSSAIPFNFLLIIPS